MSKPEIVTLTREEFEALMVEPEAAAWSQRYQSNMQYAGEILLRELQENGWKIEHLPFKPRQTNSQGELTALGWEGAYNFLHMRVETELAKKHLDIIRRENYFPT